MKKILMVGVLGFGLIGCKEPNSGLQKNVINTSFIKCSEYLTSSLKSPSSLRVVDVSVAIQQPDSNDVYSIFSNKIIKNNKISEIIRDNKTRYREMLIVVDYEAQNLFGVYLNGIYQCKYLYELNNDEVSPQALNTHLVTLKSDGKNIDMEGIHIPIAEFTGSNVFLDKKIKRIMSTEAGSFDAKDEQMYTDILQQHNQSITEKEVQAFKNSWGGWGS